jgi:hypothetical protein
MLTLADPASRDQFMDTLTWFNQQSNLSTE